MGSPKAPAFPASSKATGYWFPRRERARATSVFDAAAKFSNVIGVPLVAYFVQRFGWRSGFGVTGALSFAYFVAFQQRIYRDPGADKSLTPRRTLPLHSSMGRRSRRACSGQHSDGNAPPLTYE